MTKEVLDILAELASAKAKRLKIIHSALKEIGGVQPVDAEKAYEAELKEGKLMTGTIIDNMLGGGLIVGSSMLLYGEFGSGKTETCFTMAILCPDRVVYIDTEGSFRWTRIKQMCDARGIDFKSMFKKIILFQPQNWIEQMMVIDAMPNPKDGKVGLIIIDSLTKLFRGIEFAGRQELGSKQPMIREYPIALKEICQAYGAAMIFTTQIYQSPSSNPFLPDWANENAVGGASLQHQATYVVHLRRAGANARIARLIDADDQPLAERPYIITEKGIEDVPETQKAQKLLERTEAYEEKVKSSLDDPSKRGRKPKSDSPSLLENEEEQTKTESIETEGSQ